MLTPRILGFLFDDENEDKMGAHGLTPRRLNQVLDNDYLVVRNRRGRRAPYLIIGRDNGGGCIAIPVEATRDPGLWRPVTAWLCKESERARLQRG